MKTILFTCKHFEKAYLEHANKGKHLFIYQEQHLSSETVSLCRGNEAAVIFAGDDASAPVLEKLKEFGIKYIALRSAGYDNIDLKRAGELGFKVANVPEYSPNAIAEHAITLILALDRKIIRSNKQVRDYNFSLDHLIGFNLHEKTVGIVGTGKIGSVVAKILHGFGCKIIAYDISPSEVLTIFYGVKYISLEELCKESDIITLHTPLNKKTKYLINAANISLMKQGVMLINTGRGAVLNTIDVIEALKSNHIGYLGLDVYENEKGLFFENHSEDILQDDLFARLLSFKNVLITGHHAFLTKEALQNIALTTVYNLDSWEKGNKSINELIH